jgi:hypothetical protein
MPFLVGCIALGTPRLAILLVVLFSNYIGSAYETTLWADSKFKRPFGFAPQAT